MVDPAQSQKPEISNIDWDFLFLEFPYFLKSAYDIGVLK